MTTQSVGIFWAITSVLIVGCHGSSTRSEELLRDLDDYVNAIHKAHGDPFRRISEEDFNNRVDALRQSVRAGKDGGVSLVEWYFQLQELAASMQDGHTSVRFPGQSWKSLEPIFPFRLRVLDGNAYAIEKWGKDSVPLFSQILEINEIPIERLYTRSSRLYNTSLDHAKDLMFEVAFSHLLTTYLGLKAPWKVTFRHDDRDDTTTVQGITNDEYLSAWRRIGKSRYREYSITVGDKEVPVLEIPSYSHGDTAGYHRFIDKFFEKHEEPEYLVIDLRLNGGGSGVWGYYVLDYLADSPYMVTKSYTFKVSDLLRNSEYSEKAGEGLADAENGKYLTFQSDLMRTPHTDKNKFRGKVFLLISERTFSAGAVTAAIFKFNNMGTIIGQESSGREKMCSDPITVDLPHSKLQVTIPVAIYTLPGDNPDRGVVPDIEIQYCIEDIENGSDKEMDKVRELVREAS